MSSLVPLTADVRPRLRHVARQHPLVETRPSLQALEDAPARAPKAVFVGIGVASGQRVSRALPIDVLGLLLAAEDVRRASRASELVVLLADAHAVAHGASERRVWERAASYERLLTRIRDRCSLGAMRVVRAWEMHEDAAYRATLSCVERRAPAGTNPYVTREVADIAHLDRTHGGIIKVGWALQASPVGAERDERLFDDRFREWLGRDMGFVYTKAGRALDDDRHKVAPYLESDLDRRICLEPNEDVGGKMALASRHASPSTVRGVRNHLNAIARTYCKLVRPVSGTVEERAQAMIDHLVVDGHRPTTLEPTMTQS